MSEIPLRITEYLDEVGDPIYMRVMNAEEVRERAEENSLNISSNLRAKVLKNNVEISPA